MVIVDAFHKIRFEKSLIQIKSLRTEIVLVHSESNRANSDFTAQMIFSLSLSEIRAINSEFVGFPR